MPTTFTQLDGAVQAGESCDITGQFKDLDDTAIVKASLTTFIISLYNAATNAIINSIEDEDALDANNHTVATDGTFHVRIDLADNIIVDTGSIVVGGTEKHILKCEYTWTDDASVVRTGIQHYAFEVQRLPTVS